MKHIRLSTYRLPILLTLAVLLLAACGGHQTSETHGTDTKIVVPTASVERLEVPSEIEIFGTVEAERTAAISSRVMAMVTAVRVQTGDEVRRGDLIGSVGNTGRSTGSHLHYEVHEDGQAKDPLYFILDRFSDLPFQPTIAQLSKAEEAQEIQRSPLEAYFDFPRDIGAYFPGQLAGFGGSGLAFAASSL